MKFYLDKAGNDIEYVLLTSDNWDDFGYKTTFYATYYNENYIEKLGMIGIGMKESCYDKSYSTKDYLEQNFEKLNGNYFTLGTEEFYGSLNKLEKKTKEKILVALNDVVNNSIILNEAKYEPSFIDSLTRSITFTEITGRLRRIVNNEKELDFYQFNHSYQDETLTFKVDPHSTIPSNIHAIIGSNGAGKTTLLKSIVESFNTDTSNDKSKPVNIVYCSFSIFDTFNSKDYIDNKKINVVTLSECSGTINDEVNKMYKLSIENCLKADKKKLLNRLYNFISENPSLSYLNIKDLLDENNTGEQYITKFELMSSGHKIIILTITKLVEVMEEKTLLLFDEPEVHLHPPLLSTLISALKILLKDRNGMGIIATHSPIVLQEISSNCIYKISEIDGMKFYNRLGLNTLGENVGRLTSEVFSHEFTKSGIYKEIEKKCMQGYSVEQIIKEYDDKLGSEAIAMATGIIYSRKVGERV